MRHLGLRSVWPFIRIIARLLCDGGEVRKNRAEWARMKKILLTTITSVTLSVAATLTTARAETSKPDPFQLDLPGFSTSFSFSSAGKSDLKAGGSFTSSAYDFGASQTIPLNEKASFDLGLSYGVVSLDQTKPNARTPLPKDLRSLALNLGYSQELNDTWSFAAGVSPGAHAAGNSFASKSFGVDGYVLGIYTYSPSLAVSGGFGYSSLSKDALGPVFGINWIINEQWTASVGYPSTAITYTLSDTWQFSLLLDGLGGSYYVENDPQSLVSGRPSLKGSKLDYSESRMGLSANYQLSPSVGLALTAGVVLDQTIEYHDPKYKVKSDSGAGYVSFAVNVAF